MRTPGAHVRKTCARPRKCARRAPSAPLISNTGLVEEHSRMIHLDKNQFKTIELKRLKLLDLDCFHVVQSYCNYYSYALLRRHQLHQAPSRVKEDLLFC